MPIFHCFLGQKMTKLGKMIFVTPFFQASSIFFDMNELGILTFDKEILSNVVD
jgi:hypothetical protein